MDNTQTGRMNTDYVGHHISSGGFVFYRNKSTGLMSVMLIKNKKGEYWIPKGHIEQGEDQVSAARREIEEEVGIKQDKLIHIGLCHIHKYSPTDKKGNLITKEIYMNVFEVLEKPKITLEEGDTEITGGAWFPYEIALQKIIPYSKKQLIEAMEMVNIRYAIEQNKNKSFEAVKEELPLESFAKDLTSFIVFGSSIFNYMGKAPDDVDVCVVVNNREADLQKISDYIFDSFAKPDFRIYFQDEVESNLSFMDKGIGVFAAEYFASGISLYGENIFVKKLKSINKRSLRQAYLNKIFEYIIRIRVAYFSRNSTPEYKMWHTLKYVIRLSIDILLFEGHIKYSDLSKVSKYSIIDLCKKYGIVRKETPVDFDSVEDLYSLYCEINKYVVSYHTKGLKNKIKRIFRS